MFDVIMAIAYNNAPNDVQLNEVRRITKNGIDCAEDIAIIDTIINHATINPPHDLNTIKDELTAWFEDLEPTPCRYCGSDSTCGVCPDCLPNENQPR